MRIPAKAVLFCTAASLLLVACSENQQVEVSSEPSGQETTAASEVEFAVEESVEEPIPAPVPDPPAATPVLREDSVEAYGAIDWRDADQVSNAIAALEAEGGQASIDALGVILERSDDPVAKLEAIDALAFLSEEGDVRSPLERALDNASPDVRIEAVDVVAELALFELLPALRAQQYRESDLEVREALDEAVFELEEEEREQPF